MELPHKTLDSSAQLSRRGGRGPSAYKRAAQLSLTGILQNASRGSARKDLDVLTAVALLRAAIERKKAKIDSRELPKTVLAISARHTPQAAAPRVLDSYTEQYGCPVEEFGFASVWVVGSSANYCERLGGGGP